MTSRRNFIKYGAASISSLALAGCSSIDRFFLGDKRVLDEEILIIGGGLTGLAAAYQLKKMKAPYRIVEASHRVGGRILSSTAVEGVKSVVEMGASHLYEHNTEALALIKELRLNVDKQKYFPSEEVYISNGRELRKAELKKQLRFFNNYFNKKYQELSDLLAKQDFEKLFHPGSEFTVHDTQSLDEIFENVSFGLSFEAVNYIYDAIQMEFGTSSLHISVFHVILNWPELRAKYFDFNLDVISIQQGNEQLTKTLFERASGAVSDYLVRKNYKLIEIKDLSVSYELTFQTPKGQETLFAQKVLFAIPPKSFKDVKGIEYFEEWKDVQAYIDTIEMGRHIQITGQVKKTNTEAAKSLQRVFFGDGLGKIVESRGHGEFLMRAHAEDYLPDPKSFERFMAPVSKMFSGAKLSAEQELFILDWSRQEYIKGSRPYINKNRARNSDWLFNKKKKTNIMFAGDWTEPHGFGTLSAALKSGLDTARIMAT